MAGGHRNDADNNSDPGGVTLLGVEMSSKAATAAAVIGGVVVAGGIGVGILAAFKPDVDRPPLFDPPPPGSAVDDAQPLAPAVSTGVVAEGTDPADDHEDPAPFDRHDDPPPSVDLEGATVTVEGNTTTITICFYGSAQDLITAEGQNAGGQSLGFDILLSRPPNSQFLNIRYNSNGDFSKVSDPPPGVSVTHRWLSPSDCNEFTIIGWTPVDGSVVTVQTLAAAGGGPPSVYSKDVLELIVSMP